MLDLANGLCSGALFDLGFDWLVRATVWFTATSLLVMLLRPLLRKLNAALAYVSWLLLPLMVPLSLLLHQLPQVASLSLPAGARTVVTGMQVAVAALPQQATVAPWVLAVWWLGALLCGLAMTLQHRRYARGLTLAGAGVVGREFRAPDARGPALLGVWRPKIVLPNNFEQRFDAQEQMLIRAHEAVHQTRRDNAWNALAVGALCLQWFNPIAHIAWRQMRADQELSCDAAWWPSFTSRNG